MMALEKPGKKWGFWRILLVFIVPLLAGLLASLLIPRPNIGVIYFNDEIYNFTANQLITQIRFAYQNANIKAVVIIMDSPGGTVTDTEAVYMEMNRLRERKPVVVMVQGMAASGAYYLASATDYIVAEPSALVGNIGVIRYMPSTPSVSEDEYSTGPYKLWGGPGETFIREMELMKQGFLNAVKLGRESRLKINDEQLLRGQIWPGAVALKLGLVDELGSQSRAIERAAQLAHISHYGIIDLRDASGLPDESTYYPAYLSTGSSPSTRSFPSDPGFYYLYIPSLEGQP
jgi:protease-4